MKSLKLLVVVLLLGALLFSACGPKTTPAPATTEVPATEAPKTQEPATPPATGRHNRSQRRTNGWHRGLRHFAGASRA